VGLTASSHSKASADFDGNKAGSIETWVWSGVDSQSATQTTIKYVFGFDQTSSYSDTQDFDAWISSSSVYSSTFSNNKGSDSWQFYETTRTYTRPAYGSSTEYHSARAQVSGIFDGPTSDTGTHDISTGVPAKAGAVLGAPGGFSATPITSTTITYNWSQPASAGIGPAESNYWLQVTSDPTFATGFVFNSPVGLVGSRLVSGLAKSTTYYARVWAINAVGNGAFASVAASTLGTAPDTMVAPTVGSPTSGGYTVSFVTPGNGGSAITSYTIQVSKDNFSTVQTYSGVPSSPKVLTGLLPGVKYKTRVAAVNANGTGTFSPDSAEIQTLGGVKIWTGSTWGEGIVRNWNGTAWVVVIVRKWNGTSWVV
jgi:hypothetical protein